MGSARFFSSRISSFKPLAVVFQSRYVSPLVQFKWLPLPLFQFRWLLHRLVQKGESIVCFGGKRKAHKAARVVDDNSKASASSGAMLSETSALRETIFFAASEPRKKLTGRRLPANHHQRGRQLQRSEPQRELLRLKFPVASRTYQPHTQAGRGPCSYAERKIA